MKFSSIKFPGLCEDAFSAIRAKVMKYNDKNSQIKETKVLVHVFANNEYFGGPNIKYGSNIKGNTQEENLIKAAKNDFDKFWKGKDVRNFYPIDEIMSNESSGEAVIPVKLAAELESQEESRRIIQHGRTPIPYKNIRAFLVDFIHA